MEDSEKAIKDYKDGFVHFILANSYLMFLFSVILGVIFDTYLNKKIFDASVYKNEGFFLLIIGTILIYWAQKVSANYQERKVKKESRSKFEFGPYKFLRSPTHFGLFLMTLGFALIINSLFSIVFTLIAYVISKFLFLRKEERILEKKYGDIYTEYKKKVKNWV